jgi:Tat protein secretion system quality control protein TatD with DNase activity
LDKVAKHPETGQRYDAQRQMEAFKAQWVLAAELGRPVSVHCVRRHGAIIDFFLDQAKQSDIAWPPSVVLHAFTGSVDTAKRCFALEKQLSRQHTKMIPRFYFSLSAAIHGSRASHCIDWLKVVPLDRLLLESDLHRVQDVDTAMADVVQMAAEYYGDISALTLAQRTWDNAFQIFTSPTLS